MKNIVLFFLWIGFPLAALAQQDTLRGNFSGLHLVEKTYYIAEVITVTDSLIVDAGANIIFGNSVSVVCLGKLQMKGNADKRIVTKSDAGVSGQGFVIINNADSEVSIRYTRFENLLLPLNFEYGWSRPSVVLEQNEFIKNAGSTAVLQVLNPGLTGDAIVGKTVFVVKKNLFAENLAPVYFEDLVSDRMQVILEANVFANNRITEYGKYTFSSNFLFGRMDKTASQYKAIITANSFVGNVLWDNNADTVLHAANIGMYGSLDSLLVPGNYWGALSEREIRKGIYDYTVNYTSPKLVVNNFLTEPSDTVPSHVYKIEKLPPRETHRASYRMRDGKWKQVVDSIGSVINDNYALWEGLQALQVTPNRPLLIDKQQVRLVYLKDSLKISDTVFIRTRMETTYDKEGLIFDFDYRTDSIFRAKRGYLAITDLRGTDGGYIPEIRVGYAAFLRFYQTEKLAYELRSKKRDSLEGQNKIIQPPVVRTFSFKKRYELGFMGAYALYYGTLSNKKLFSNDFNSFAGIQFRYSLKNHISLSLSLMKMTLTGSDMRSGDTVKMARGFSFTTPVTNISLQVEYDFFDNRVYSSRNKIRPSIGFGVDYIKFAPKGEYLGKLYDLQSLGTGGQHLPGAENAPYALSSLGAPITLQLRYLLNKKMIYSLFASYHLAFTDYLDDVGPDPYPDPVALAAANPALADPAVFFANPTKKLVGKNQLRSGVASGADSFFTFGFTLAYHF